MKNNLFFGLVLMVAFTSCRFVEGQRVKGNGNIRTEQRSVTGFSGVETHGSIDIEVTQGDYKVVVESDENIIPEIVTEVENGRLIVHFKEGFTSFSYSSAKVYVTAPSLNALGVHGSGNIESKGTISNNDKMEIVVSGSGDIHADIHSPSVSSETNGSGNITLTGETKDFSSSISGSGDVHAYDLKSEIVKTSTHGSGNMEVSASVKLESGIFGSGDVDYKGSPQVSSEVHGSGSINRN
jgi:hypothetical protein